MRVSQELVEIFHRRNGLEVAEKPALVEVTLSEHRHDLIAEEAREYLDAVHADDLAGVADALADLLYVVLGTCVVHGIDIQPIFEEVHRSNMTKTPLDPVTRKGGKGPGYEKPRIADLLIIQTTELEYVPGL